MTLPLGECVGIVAPYYNLALVVVVIALFFKLFSLKNKGLFMEPWRLLFVALIIFVVEEVLTVLSFAGVLSYPRILNAVFEFIIIIIFIYMLLVQKEYVDRKTRKRKNAK